MVSPALLHAIAVACKDHYTLRTINDLFIFAGAQVEWQQEPSTPRGSERESAVYGWIQGIQDNSPDQAHQIIDGVVTQLLENPEVKNPLRGLLERHLGFAAATAVQKVPTQAEHEVRFPSDVRKLLDRLIRGLTRAMFPLMFRRKDKPTLSFEDEYDIQDLFHSQLRPWISDIRTEEYTPSYAGSSTRIDFLCFDHKIVIEIKYVRDRAHSRNLGKELVIDIDHYMAHPNAEELWIVVYDPKGYVQNPDSLRDLSGSRTNKDRSMEVISYVIGAPHSPPKAHTR
jgi:hypothetical protein